MATIYDWATQASGSTIVGSLTATAAEYQGQITIGTVTYGLIKYTFSGSPTLSSVIAGHRLTITGMTNALNNASGLVVYSADDAADTITVRSTVRTDATADETGASGTGTVTTAGAAVQKPSDSYIEQGFAAPGKPSDAYWNWVISQMATIVQSVDSRASNIYAGPSQVSSSSYADLDGAGIDLGFDGVASNQTWTASANDAAYESFTGLNVDPVVANASNVLHIATWEMTGGQATPVEVQLDIDGSTQYEFVTNTGGLCTGGSLQQTWSFSFANVNSQAAGTPDYNTEAKRRTGLTATNARSWAIELPTQDQSSNTLVRFSTTAISQATFNSGSYADLTGYTSGSQSFTSGNKALIIAHVPIDTSAVSNQTRPSVKLFRDATELFVYNNNGGGSFSSGIDDHETGTMLPFAFIDDVTGSHTYKLTGLYSTSGSGAAVDYGGDNKGALHVIELPATWDGDTLVRATDDFSSVNISDGAGFSELGTSGSVTTNGHRVLMMLFCEFTTGGTSTTTTFQFKIDASAEGPEFDCVQTQNFNKPMVLFWFADAPSAGSHTFSVDWKAVGDSASAVVGQFAALEMPVTASDGGDAPSVTLTNTTGKKVELTYAGSVNASNAELGFQITENIDGGGAVADGNEFTFTPQSGEDTPFTFRTVVDAPASGSTAVYKLQGKIASGTANISAGDFTARELPADGS